MSLNTLGGVREEQAWTCGFCPVPFPSKSPRPGLPELLPAGPALPSALPRSIPGCIQCAPGPCRAAPKATAAPEPKGCRRPDCPANSTALARAGSSSQALIAHTHTLLPPCCTANPRGGCSPTAAADPVQLHCRKGGPGRAEPTSGFISALPLTPPVSCFCFLFP